MPPKKELTKVVLNALKRKPAASSSLLAAGLLPATGRLRVDLTPTQYAEFILYMLARVPGFYAPPARRPKNPFKRPRFTKKN
jgi:hypothetical protein